MSTYTLEEISAMSDDEIARHMSRGYGPDKFTKMANTIRAIIKVARR